MPTEAERRGDFSASARQPTDPLTRQPFPNGIIPANRIDPTARRIIDKYIPAANLPGNFYEVTQSQPWNSDEMQIKVDHSLGSKPPAHRQLFPQRGQQGRVARGQHPVVAAPV